MIPSPNIDRRGEKRTELVGAKPSSNERKDLRFNFTTTSNSIRCAFKRIRDLLPGTGTTNWITLDSLMKAAKYTVFTFTRMYLKAKSIHIQTDSIIALGDYTKQNLNYLEQGHTSVFFGQGDHTAEHLAEVLNKETDFQSKTVKESSKWILIKPQIFQSICKQ